MVNMLFKWNSVDSKDLEGKATQEEEKKEKQEDKVMAVLDM